MVTTYKILATQPDGGIDVEYDVDGEKLVERVYLGEDNPSTNAELDTAILKLLPTQRLAAERKSGVAFAATKRGVIRDVTNKRAAMSADQEGLPGARV